MRDYELVVLYHPDLEIDLDKALKKIEGIIKDQKGTINHSDNWGKRKLAYPIKKQDYAVYVYYEVSLPAEAVSSLENTLNITNEALRYLITQPVPKVEEEESKDDKESDDSKESKDETTTDKPAKDEASEAEKKEG